jgi:hypothetical protein
MNKQNAIATLKCGLEKGISKIFPRYVGAN